MTTFLSNRDIYTSVVCGIVPQARKFRQFLDLCGVNDEYDANICVILVSNSDAMI